MSVRERNCWEFFSNKLKAGGLAVKKKLEAQAKPPTTVVTFLLYIFF